MKRKETRLLAGDASKFQLQGWLDGTCSTDLVQRIETAARTAAS
jgi:hypothetical protein